MTIVLFIQASYTSNSSRVKRAGWFYTPKQKFHPQHDDHQGTVEQGKSVHSEKLQEA